jgi:predicted lipoprotein with Yx(FWY)xxD motif
MRRAILVIVGVMCLGTAGTAPAGTRGATVVKALYNKHLKATILVNPRGLTLYIWTTDPKQKSVCNNDPTYHCSKAWPPLVTTGRPRAGAGVKQSLLGTTKRDDGRMQVTYAGRPLYTWAGYLNTPPDRKPGDLNGQGYISSWYAITPAAKLVYRP